MIEPAFLDIDTEEESMRRTRGTFGCILMILTRVYWTEICDGMQMKMSERYVIASVNGVCESAKLHRAQQTRQVSIIISCSVWFLPSPIKVSSATIYLSIIYFYILYFKLYCKCGRFFHAIHQRTLPMKSMMQLNTWKALSGHCIKARKRYVYLMCILNFKKSIHCTFLGNWWDSIRLSIWTQTKRRVLLWRGKECHKASEDIKASINSNVLWFSWNRKVSPGGHRTCWTSTCASRKSKQSDCTAKRICHKLGRFGCFERTLLSQQQ